MRAADEIKARELAASAFRISAETSADATCERIEASKFEEDYGTYGAPRIHAELAATPVAHQPVAGVFISDSFGTSFATTHCSDNIVLTY